MGDKRKKIIEDQQPLDQNGQPGKLAVTHSAEMHCERLK
jgi:hypothetical protein